MNDFNVLFYSSPNPMWVFDTCTLQILEVNDASINAYGYSKAEFLSKTIKDLRPPDDVKLVESILPQIRTNQTHFREFRHKDSQGKVFHVEIMSYPIIFNGRDTRLVVTQNIEERKAIAGQLEFTQTKLNKILESTSIGFFQTDLDCKITYWNTAAEKIIGYNRSYVLGKNIWDVLTEAVDSDFYDMYHEAMEKRVNVEFNFYYWPIQKWFAVNAYPVIDGLIMHFRDVTENKVYEERLLEKIDQLQEVSYLNSHYIRKPVATLLGLTNLIADNIVDGKEYKDIAAQIQQCSIELDDIVRKINNRVNENFTDCLFDTLSNFSLTGVIKNQIEKFYYKTPSHTVVLTTDKEITFYGNKHGLEVAIDCLITNATKFTDGAGKIEVSLELIDNNVILSVKDNGVGIDNKTISRIFMSFTKKSVAKELGSGLSKISEVAHRHNGNVWVESKPGNGAVFSMRLPLSNIVPANDYVAPRTSGARHGVNISYNKELGCVVADWYGFHSLHSAKAGCLKLLKSVVENNCRAILNDNTGVMGTWDEAVEWVAKEFFPMLQDANVTHIAWVYSKSTFSRLSADLAIDTLAGNIQAKAFDNKEVAGKWLMQVNNNPVQLSYKPE